MERRVAANIISWVSTSWKTQQLALSEIFIVRWVFKNNGNKNIHNEKRDFHSSDTWPFWLSGNSLFRLGEFGLFT